ncbi:hypothetical protein ACLX1H_006453 [Fusarium chlamydosporum]
MWNSMGQIPTDINYGTCPGQKNAISYPASILETITVGLDANIEEALGVRATMEASPQQRDTFDILLGNTAYMLALDFGKPNRFALCAELRGRAGTLAVANMLPLIIMAGRNNPLIRLLGVSFDTYNLLHRWIGRIVLFDVVIHAVAWAIPSIADSGWSQLGRNALDGLFVTSGSIGVIAMFLISAVGLSPVRHAFYETFLAVHIILALTAIICVWIHCATSQLPGALPQLPWIQAVVALWVSERLARILRLVYINWSGAGFTNATCEAMPGEVTRVTVRLPRSVRVNPGSHAYLRFRDVRVWESHPFSIAWVEDRVKCSQISHDDYLPSDEGHDVTTDLTFIIAARSGMTCQLYEKVRRARVLERVLVAVEGPYNGHQCLDSYGHVVLFAGATGITHQISYAHHILTSYEASVTSTRRLLLLWVIREHECIGWVWPSLMKTLRSQFCHDILRIKVFVTGGVKQNMLLGTNPIVSFHSGRPEVLPVLKKEVERQTGAMCVTVCGPGALADDVRHAVRVMQGPNVIDFVEESFTW